MACTLTVEKFGVRDGMLRERIDAVINKPKDMRAS